MRLHCLSELISWWKDELMSRRRGGKVLPDAAPAAVASPLAIPDEREEGDPIGKFAIHGFTDLFRC